MAPPGSFWFTTTLYVALLSVQTWKGVAALRFSENR
jgi:hypothetical protein